MVRLEQYGGGTAYVLQGTIVGVRSASSDGFTVVDRKDLSSLTVKGTPDEVHAKLFPETSRIRDVDAAVSVLAEIAGGADAGGLSVSDLRTLARKALGREGT